MRSIARLTAVGVLLLAGSNGGAPHPFLPAGTNGGSSRAVPGLPDLTAFEPSVQEQLRHAHATLLDATTRGADPAEQASAYGHMGALLFASDDLAGAEHFLLEAQALAGSNIRWPYYLAHLYRRRGDLTAAAKWFEEVRRTNPSDLATLTWLGRVYVDAGQPEAAEPPLAKALELSPRSPAVLSAIGRAALARNEYARAAVCFEDALTLLPSASALHYLAAMAYRGAGDTSKAEAHLLKRGDVDASPPDALMRELDALLESPVRYQTLGLDALEKGLWAEAEQHFRKGLALRPAEPGLRAALGHGLGTVLAMSGNSAAAQAQFEEGVETSPTYAKNYYSLGVLEAMAGRDADAIVHFTEAVKREPDYAQAHLVLADTLRRSGRADAALVQYREVLRIDPGMAEARFGAVLALVRLQRFAEAAATVAEGITNHPDDPRFPHALARLLAAAPDASVRDGRRALSIVNSLSKQGMSVELAETVAMALAELGRYQEAAAWQRRAISSASNRGATDMSRRMADNLGLYERRQPCRTPWRLADLIHSANRPAL